MREAYVNFHSLLINCLKWPRWLRPWTISLFEGFNHVKNTGVLICDLVVRGVLLVFHLRNLPSKFLHGIRAIWGPRPLVIQIWSRLNCMWLSFPRSTVSDSFQAERTTPLCWEHMFQWGTPFVSRGKVSGSPSCVIFKIWRYTVFICSLQLVSLCLFQFLFI